MKKYYLNDQFYLRNVKRSDANDIFEIASDFKITKYLSWEPHRDIKTTRRVIKDVYLSKRKENIPNSFAIVDLKSKKVIGIIDYSLIDNNDVEIGYYLAYNYWNLGIMTKALAKLIKLGFEKYKFDSIGISHIKENEQSMRVIEKNNFNFKGMLKTKINNNYYDMMYYKILKKEYFDDK